MRKIRCFQCYGVGVKRGRPRYNDVLTPREWEVIALLADRLTNEQIAVRLGISENTVKSHVSEILSKLDLADRLDASRWYAVNERRALALVPFFGWFERHSWRLSLKVAGGLLGAVTLTAMAALAVGVLLMDSRDSASGPPHAPEGRTGDSSLDRIIDALVEEDADGLRSQFPGVVARGLSPDFEQTAIGTEEWTALLASSSRQLYSVSTADPQASPDREFDIALGVATPGSSRVGWRISVADGQVVDLTVGRDGSPPSSYSPSVERQYDRFLVLPPRDELPMPPAAHELKERTGNAGVDGLVSLLGRRDGAALLSRTSFEQVACGSEDSPGCLQAAPPGTMVDALPVRDCPGFALRDADFVDRWLGDLAEKALSLHAVATLPDGYRPGGEHLLIIVTQEEPYRWEVSALVEERGQIVGLITSCGGDGTTRLYPPASYLAPPPPLGDVAPTRPDRETGVPLVDDILQALTTGDISALSGLVDYERVGCVSMPDGIGSPPECLPGEAPGTSIEVLPISSCEGHFSRRQGLEPTLERLSSDGWRLYAVSDLGSAAQGQAGFGRGSTQVVLSRPGSDQPTSLALSLSSVGFTSLRYPCGVNSPEALLAPGRAPEFLLPPP
ncbi:MAG: hypothetical protein GEU75_11830 [Dehalococcoidia bacterium]|nr:hypothetical protein [Dehalococcoidia bacterium]